MFPSHRSQCSLNLPLAAALDVTDLERTLQVVIVAAENAGWLAAVDEGPAKDDEDDGGSNLKGRYRFNVGEGGGGCWALGLCSTGTVREIQYSIQVLSLAIKSLILI